MKTEQLLLAKFHKFYNKLSKTKDSQGRILKIVSGHDGISQKDLQVAAGIKPGSLSEVLIKLEKLGYIVRRPDQSDKRKHNVFITEDGMEAFGQIHKGHELESEKLFAPLNQKEKLELIGLLDKLLGDSESFKGELKKNNRKKS